jgi:hypothetical protein
MILFAIICLLVGAVLAQRFKIMVMAPATAFVILTAVCTGVMQSQTAFWTILISVAAGASMQIGYVIGLGIRYVLEAPLSESPQSFKASASSARHPAR